MKKILFLALIATSCAPVYIPNARNSPAFTKKGEFQASAQVGNGINGQVAFAPTSNFGIIGNYSYLKRSDYDNHPEDYSKHTFAEFGLGYFKNSKSMFFEVFAGYGEGTGTSYDTYTFISTSSVSASGSYKRYFIQPAFGMNKKTVHVSFVPRFSIVDFTEFSNGGVRYTVDEDPVVYFEPAVVSKVHFHDNVYFTFQGGFSVPLAGDTFYDYRVFQFSTGLGLRFGAVKKAE